MVISLIVGLYVLAAVLPTAGLARALLRREREVRGVADEIEQSGTELTWDDLEGTRLRDLAEVNSRRVDAVWDTLLIGVGLVCGAVASIWSLFV